MRYDQRSCSRIEESPSKAGERLCAGLVLRRRVTSGKNGPIGVELELGNLAGRKEPIIEIIGLLRDRERQRRLGLVLGKRFQIATSPCVAK
jgi:hypothetical protein